MAVLLEEEQGIKRLDASECRNVPRRSWDPNGGASLRAWSTTSRLPRIAGHGRVVGAKRRLPISSARSSGSPAPSRHDRRSGWMLLNRRSDTHSDTRPDRRPRWTPCLAGWTARADTKADGHRDRPHAGRVPLVVCSRPSVRVGRGVRITNDSSPPWAAVRPGVRVWCPAVQGGSVHPDRHGARDGQAPGPTVALTALRASSLAA
jgi:hypothetical protein